MEKADGGRCRRQTQTKRVAKRMRGEEEEPVETEGDRRGEADGKDGLGKIEGTVEEQGESERGRHRGWPRIAWQGEDGGGGGEGKEGFFGEDAEGCTWGEGTVQ